MGCAKPAPNPRVTLGYRGVGMDGAGSIRYGKRKRRIALSRVRAAQAAVGRARPWGSLKSISGPRGTMPLGLIDSWLP